MVFMIILSFLIGCGGGGDTAPATNPVSQAQADAIAGQISRGAVNAMMSGGVSTSAVSGKQNLQNNTIDCELCGTNSSIVPEKQVPQNITVESTQVDSKLVVSAAPCVTVPINISVNQRTTCTAGGYITVLGGATGSVSSCGSGIIQIELVESIVNWQCVGGWIVNGDPYVSLVATFTFLNGAPATRQDMTINGGFKWGTAAAESCQIHLNTNFDLNAGSSRTTGTVCGYSVNISTS
jgi:hypothetical protein